MLNILVIRNAFIAAPRFLVGRIIAGYENIKEAGISL